MIPFNLQEYSTEALWRLRTDIENANAETDAELREMYAAKKQHELSIRQLLSHINKLSNKQSDRQDAYYRIGKELRNRGAINYKNFRLKTATK